MMMQMNGFLNATPHCDEDDNLSMSVYKKHRITLKCERVGSLILVQGGIATHDRSMDVGETFAKILKLPQSVVSEYKRRVNLRELRVCDVIEFLPFDKRLMISFNHDEKRKSSELKYSLPEADKIHKIWPTWEETLS